MVAGECAMLREGQIVHLADIAQTEVVASGAKRPAALELVSVTGKDYERELPWGMKRRSLYSGLLTSAPNG